MWTNKQSSTFDGGAKDFNLKFSPNDPQNILFNQKLLARTHNVPNVLKRFKTVKNRRQYNSNQQKPQETSPIHLHLHYTSQHSPSTLTKWRSTFSPNDALSSLQRPIPPSISGYNGIHSYHAKSIPVFFLKTIQATILDLNDEVLVYLLTHNIRRKPLKWLFKVEKNS